MNANLKLIFNIGMYSFAEIPKMYDLILGVSGTIADMSEYKKLFIRQQFKITKETISPSIYDNS